MNSYISVKTAFALVIGCLVLSLLVTVGILYSLPKNSIESGFTTSLIIFVSEIWLITPLFVFLFKVAEVKSLPDIRGTLRLNALPVTTLLTTIILSLGLTVLSDEVDRLIVLILPPPEWVYNRVMSLKCDTTLELVLTFLASVIVAPVFEELVFRGFFQQVLERQWKDITRAVLVTSIFFALIHSNPWWVIQIYFIGIFLGYLAWRTNSVFASILFHAINNAVAFALVNWGDKIESWYVWKGHISPLFLLGGVVCVAFGFYQLSRFDKIKTE